MQLQSCCRKRSFSRGWIYSLLGTMKSFENPPSLQSLFVREICWESCCKQNKKYPNNTVSTYFQQHDAEIQWNMMKMTTVIKKTSPHFWNLSLALQSPKSFDAFHCVRRRENNNSKVNQTPPMIQRTTRFLMVGKVGDFLCKPVLLQIP